MSSLDDLFKALPDEAKEFFREQNLSPDALKHSAILNKLSKAGVRLLIPERIVSDKPIDYYKGLARDICGADAELYERCVEYLDAVTQR